MSPHTAPGASAPDADSGVPVGWIVVFAVVFAGLVASMLHADAMQRPDAGQCFTDHVEFFYFTEKIVCSGRHAALSVLAIWVVGDHHDDRCRWAFFEILEKIDSASSRQPYVQNDNIRV